MRLLIFLAILPCAFAVQNPYYVAQSSAGSANGTSCGNAYSVATFNSAGSWGSGSTQIGAGTVVHFCGAITTALNIQGSGTSGNVIEFLWESGARITLPFNQIINLVNGNNAFLLFDGGIPCGPGTSCDTIEAANLTGYASGQAGIIEATANGSALANQNVTTQAFAQCNGCHDIEIRNLIIRNLYIHSSTSDGTGSADNGNFIFQCPNGNSGCASGTISIHDNTVHDTGNSISIQRGNSTTFNIYNNDFYHDNWAVELSGDGTRTLLFHDNHTHDTTNWDTNFNPGPCGATSCFHHNTVHAYMNASADSIETDIYNNLVDGNWGTCCTTNGLVFSEVTAPDSFNIFNNVVVPSTTTAPAIGVGGVSGIIANNTLISPHESGNAEGFNYYDSASNMSFRNNVITGYGQFVSVNNDAGATFSATSNNFYGDVFGNGNSAWQWKTTGANTLSQWQAVVPGGDLNASNPGSLSALGLNSNGTIISGSSAVVHAAANLTSSCTGNIVALCSSTSAGNTVTPSARPTSGNWDVGAFQFSSGGGSPTVSLSPTSLTFSGLQTIATNSPTQTIQLTNNGTATLNITSIVPSGDFSETNTCGSTLATSSSCTVTVTFTPTAAGSRSGSVTFTTNASTSPDVASLSGTGIVQPARSGGISVSGGVLRFQ